MTRQELLAEIQEGFDGLLELPDWWVSERRKVVIRAMNQYWTNDQQGTQLDVLLGLLPPDFTKGK